MGRFREVVLSLDMSRSPALNCHTGWHTSTTTASQLAAADTTTSLELAGR
jgi:hypothetical protein